jgi:glyoxylase-like metal-dependent hydrolase (beta-lactamase superfamily II)
MGELVRGLHIVDGVSQSGSTMNVVAVLDDDGSVSLIDCGLPGSSERIFAYLKGCVDDPYSVKTIVLTHFDWDHVGSAAEIKKRTGCNVVAHELDAMVIEGARFGAEELKEMLPEYQAPEIERLQRKMANQRFSGVPVDAKVKGGETLDIAGGASVIHTPGHTPGHIVVYVKRYGALVTGDAITVRDGRVGPPVPEYTVSQRIGMLSVKKLSKIDFDILVPYHWPPLTSNASRALRAFAAGSGA